MIAEIIAIGNEVVDGSLINTNSSWLAGQLSQFGVTVRFHTAIPDDEPLMLDAFQKASERAHAVLVTGGLGPTVDDFTLEVAAKFFGVELAEDKEAVEKIRSFFKKVGRAITPNQVKQALLPKGSIILKNGLGTAPGAYFNHKGVHFAFFPGVPSEMKLMFAKDFLPILLRDSQRGRQRYLKTLRCFGLPEGQMDQALRDDIQGRLDILGAHLGFRVRFPTIDVRLYVEHDQEAEAQEILAEAAQVVQEKLGKYIFGTGEDKLQEVVGTLFYEKKKTLATAESCTGGLVADLITNVSGASEYFLEGVVTYSNAAKQDLLGVRQATLKEHGAVSAATALEMAHGIRNRAGSDFGVSVTGIAGPGGGTPEKPVGTVHMAVVHPEGEWERGYRFPFDRIRFKQLAAATVLDRMRRILLKLEV